MHVYIIQYISNDSHDCVCFIQVYGNSDDEQLLTDARFWSLMFLVLGVAQGGAYFFSVSV